jgi:hypothetical protein
MRKIIMFLGTVAGTVLIIAGVVGLKDDRSAWWLIGAGILAFIVAAMPGRRLRDASRR